MKILHLISSSGFYGAENVLINLAIFLKKDGHVPYLACIKGSSKPDPEIFVRAQRADIISSVIPCNHRLDFKAIGQIKRIIKEEKIDIVHSHGYKSNFYGLFSTKSLGVPVVATLHLWTGEDKKVKFYDWLDKLIIKKFSHLVAVSPLIYDETLKSKIGHNNLTLIPNGINTDIFDPIKNNKNLRNDLGLKDAFVIGTVGRLAEQKGHKYLIEAFDEVAKKVDNVKLLIVGDGPLKESLRSTVCLSRAKSRDGLRSKDKVVFTGFQKDMADVYKSMDIFVLPSLTEGLPLVLLEAMSMGLPAVATKVGGVPYVVNEKAAMLVPPANTRELADALLILLKDKELQKKYGEKARQRVVAEFSVEKMYRKYAEIYGKIAKGSQSHQVTMSPVTGDVVTWCPGDSETSK